MFFKVLLNYLFGYVNITIEGFFVERFINNCINRKIFLWAIKRKNTTLITANISIRQFKKIRTIAKKTNCKININSKKGLPIILHRYRKRKILLILLIPILLSVLTSSLYIWNIEIVGLNNIKQEELIVQL